MRGLPGSGKSTKAKEIAKETGAFITSLDEIREFVAGSRKEWHDNPAIFNSMNSSIAKLQYSIIELHLSKGKDVIVDNMNLKSEYINKLIKIANKYNASTELVEMKVTLDTLVERNMSRPKNDRVDENWLKEIYKKFNSTTMVMQCIDSINSCAINV